MSDITPPYWTEEEKGLLEQLFVFCRQVEYKCWERILGRGRWGITGNEFPPSVSGKETLLVRFQAWMESSNALMVLTRFIPQTEWWRVDGEAFCGVMKDYLLSGLFIPDKMSHLVSGVDRGYYDVINVQGEEPPDYYGKDVYLFTVGLFWDNPRLIYPLLAKARCPGEETNESLAAVYRMTYSRMIKDRYQERVVDFGGMPVDGEEW
jgi:hypothetical protein